ncbi:PSP1 C-terminal conserved region-domain-containing protein [Absidia repens]|uniref:PSP1 C-terminal conserved region-domain-containing protein n=1 Tax=Absidia repens TaxID=90262 RepID=A0A1X2IUN9_9FUNG|nr:PSP1 C-terminal conserved region-domain-containing protein [Absidia repens]
MGKGIPLHHFLDSNTMLYRVEFKAHRTDIYYTMQGEHILPHVGDLVIVEADRGHDLGKVIAEAMVKTHDVNVLEMPPPRLPINGIEDDPVTGLQQWYAKRLYRLADMEEKRSLETKKLDEENALMVCQTKIQQKELPMQIVNAEYQWDRRKLTFYFVADQRIDFRELVRELFKNYKTRIWMCALKSNSNGDPSAVE